MPTKRTMGLPAPKHEQEFEDICLDAAKARWKNPEFQKNGRRGQRQHGVDIFGPDELGRRIGIQCKCMETISVEVIEREIADADHFAPPLSAFYIAIAGPTDAALQRAVRHISDARLAQSSFPVGILFWDDIAADLARDDQALKLRYPNFALFQSDSGSAQGMRLLSALDISFLGSNLQYYLTLMFGEFGLLANQDPFEFRRVTAPLETASVVLLQGATAREFRDLGRKLGDDAIAAATGKAGRNAWPAVEALAVELQARVEAVEMLLHGDEHLAYRAGFLLARWLKYEGGHKGFSKDHSEELARVCEQLSLDPCVAEFVRAQADEYRKDVTVAEVHIPNTVYSRIRDALRKKELCRAGNNA